jgi:hypothetical protein
MAAAAERLLEEDQKVQRAVAWILEPRRSGLPECRF